MQTLDFECVEILVKFLSNRNGQRIRFSDFNTVVQTLRVVDDGVRLVVCYIDKNKKIVKVIVFPYADVQEYSCEYVNQDTLSIK